MNRSAIDKCLPTNDLRPLQRVGVKSRVDLAVVSKGNDFAKFTGQFALGVNPPAHGLPPISPRPIPRTDCAHRGLLRAARRAAVTLCAPWGATTTRLIRSRYLRFTGGLLSCCAADSRRPRAANSAWRLRLRWRCVEFDVPISGALCAVLSILADFGGLRWSCARPRSVLRPACARCGRTALGDVAPMRDPTIGVCASPFW